MKFKLLQIHLAQPALQKVMNADLPAKIAFRLSRIVKTIDEVFAGIEAQRSKLVQKYGEPTPGGFSVKPENIETYHKEFNELLSDESVDLDIDPIQLAWLEGIKLSALEMLALEPFLVE